MQGSDDEVVPPKSLDLLYAASDPAYTDVWQIPCAKHVKGVRTHREEYERRVLAFLDKALPAVEPAV
jgi:fermentation-respiration switch protein FrsA (DUF1100 family)